MDKFDLFHIIVALTEQLTLIQEMKVSDECPFDRRALSIAATELETAMLWLANARQ